MDPHKIFSSISPGTKFVLDLSTMLPHIYTESLLQDRFIWTFFASGFMQSSCKALASMASIQFASAWRVSYVWRLLLLGGQSEEFLPQMLNLIESAKGAAKLEIVTAFVIDILNLPETMPSRQDLLKAAVESGNDLLNSWSLTSKVQQANLDWNLNQQIWSGATCFRPWGMSILHLENQQELLRIMVSCPFIIVGRLSHWFVFKKYAGERH